MTHEPFGDVPPPPPPGPDPRGIVRRIHRVLLWVVLGVAVVLIGVALVVLLVVLGGDSGQASVSSPQMIASGALRS